MSIRNLSLSYFYLIISCLISAQLIGEDASKTATTTPTQATNVIRFAAISVVGNIDSRSYLKVKQIYAVSQNKKVDGIMMVIDSSGGNVGPAALVAEAVTRAAKCKPLISFVPGNALSAGYWIAASAPYVIAAPMSLVGSVGFVVTPNKDTTNSMFSNEKFKFARFGADGKMLSEHVEFNNNLAATGSSVFRDQIVKLRPILTDQALIDMQAKFYLGRHSLEQKLVDEVGLLKNATAELYRRVGNPACDAVELLNDENVIVASFTPQELSASQ